MNDRTGARFLLCCLAGCAAVCGEVLGQTDVMQALAAFETAEYELTAETDTESPSELSEELERMISGTICINSEEAELLVTSGLISQSQYYRLKEYRLRFGSLLSLNELLAVESWDRATYDRVVHVVSLTGTGQKALINAQKRKSPRFRHVLVAGAGRITETAIGYTAFDSLAPVYAGDPWRLRLRFDAEAGRHISAGFRMEKDPGEALLPYHSESLVRMSYPDFFSAYLLLKDLGVVRHVCIGDYRLRFGKGITLSSGSAFSSWKNPFGSISAGKSFRQNTSMAESGFLRGITVSASISGFSADLFFSRMTFDALGLKPDSLGFNSFTSISYSGYHRTAAERSSRGAVAETVYGCLAHYANNWLRAGIAVILSELSLPHQPAARVDSRWDGSGSGSLSFGAFVEVCRGRKYGYAEISGSPLGKYSVIAGLQAVLTPDASFSIGFRHFPVGFHAGFHAAGAGPYSSTDNETGLSAGFRLGLPAGWIAMLVMDAAWNPWFSYQVNFASNKYAAHCKVSRSSSTADLTLAYTYRQGAENVSGSFSYVSVVRPTARHLAECQLLITPGSRFRYKSRLIWQSVRESNGEAISGGILQQEVCGDFERPAVRATLGLILFNTEAYANGIFVYEPDLQGWTGSRTLYEEGTRTYFLVKAPLVKGVDISLKVSRVWFSNVGSTGSGPEETMGNARNEFRVQICWKL